MHKRISGRFTVDLQRDWRPFARAADDFEMVGVVKREEWDVGALAREVRTGRFICVNGGTLYELDQQAVVNALAEAHEKARRR